MNNKNITSFVYFGLFGGLIGTIMMDIVRDTIVALISEPMNGEILFIRLVLG